MSVVLYHQPHFAGQPKNVQVFWGYALLPDRVGNFVAKPMSDCGGAEILKELCGHLNFDPGVFEDAICIPCRMPYITSMFMPRSADRPAAAGAQEFASTSPSSASSSKSPTTSCSPSNIRCARRKWRSIS